MDTTPETYWRDIIGSAKDMFFYSILLNDSFEVKSLDEMKNWSVLNGKDPNGKSSFSAANVELGNNSLILRYKKSSDTITTGAVRSSEKYSYGYYETTLSMPKLKGTESTLKLVTDGDYRQGGSAFEVNIAYLDELYKLKTGYRYMKNHIPLKSKGKVVDGGKLTELKDDFAGISHTYGLLYTYDYLRYYVDGELVRVVENTFARGGAYIEISESVTGSVTEELTNKNSSMYISNVSYWQIDMDEMSKYDTLLESEKKLLSSRNTAASDQKSPASNQVRKENYTLPAVIFGIFDLLCIAGVGFIAIKGKKSGKKG